MPLSLKATVTRRQAEPVPSDLAERLQQRCDEESAPYAVNPDKARQTAVEASTAIESAKSGKPLSGKPTPSKPRF